jgi:hypothetical protein
MLHFPRGVGVLNSVTGEIYCIHDTASGFGFAAHKHEVHIGQVIQSNRAVQGDESVDETTIHVSDRNSAELFVGNPNFVLSVSNRADTVLSRRMLLDRVNK